MTDIEHKELLDLCNKHIGQRNLIFDKSKQLKSLENLSKSNERKLLEASEEKYISFAVWKQVLLWFVILCVFIVIGKK